MFVKVTSKRQVTFPAKVLDALGVKPGDQIELQEWRDGYLLKPLKPLERRRIDYSKLGTLNYLVKPDTPPFDIRTFRDDRENGLGPALELRD